MQRYSWTNNRPAGNLAPPCRAVHFNGVSVQIWSTFWPHRNKRRRTASLRTLAAISIAHWVSHFHLFVLPMLFPFLKEQLGVGYIELGFALTVFGVVSGLTQAPIGYLADHIGARKVLLMGLTLGGCALIMLGLQSELFLADRLRRTAGPRQQRLSSGRLRDPVGAYGRGADGPRLFDPHLCRLPRRRGGARHHGGAGGDRRRDSAR